MIIWFKKVVILISYVTNLAVSNLYSLFFYKEKVQSLGSGLEHEPE